MESKNREEEWVKNKPFLAPKWLARLIWFWVLKEGKEKDPYAVGYKTMLLGFGCALLISIPLIAVALITN